MRRVLDVMHIGKNIAEFVLKFLFGDKDSADSQMNIKELGICRKL